MTSISHLILYVLIVKAVFGQFAEENKNNSHKHRDGSRDDDTYHSNRDHENSNENREKENGWNNENTNMNNGYGSNKESFTSSRPSTLLRPGSNREDDSYYGNGGNIHHHGHDGHMHHNGDRDDDNYHENSGNIHHHGHDGYMHYNGDRDDDNYHENSGNIHHHGHSGHMHHNQNREHNENNDRGNNYGNREQGNNWDSENTNKNNGESFHTYSRPSSTSSRPSGHHHEHGSNMNGNREEYNSGSFNHGNNGGNREHGNNWNSENTNTNNGESFHTYSRPSSTSSRPSGHHHEHGSNMNGNREEYNSGISNHGNNVGNREQGNNWNGENINTNNEFESNSESFYMSLRPTSSSRPYTSSRPNKNQNENYVNGNNAGNNYTNRNNSNGNNWNNENTNENNSFGTNHGNFYTSQRPPSSSRPESSDYKPYSSAKLPSQSSCGLLNATINDRIVGGSPANLGDWPWIVALGYVSISSPQKSPQWLCGGTLISDRYVVTAAHCTVGIGQRKISVARLGDLDLDPDVKDGANPIDAPVEKVITHEKYNSKDYTNDIALIKLQRSISFNKLIQPICLPVESEIRSKNFVKTVATVAGWGATSYRGPSSTALLKAPVPIVDSDDCKRSYANKNTVIDERTLCAGYKTGKIDACQGDSGGPLMWPNKLKYYLIGVVSFGFKCADPDFPGVYSRVTYFVDWIIETMNKN